MQRRPSNLDDEYEKLVLRMNTPRVVIDNTTCPTATLIKVDSVRNHAFLLDTVQLLAYLNLTISKAYISSDGPYFMDVFHVTHHSGHKLADQSIISYIQQSLQTSTFPDQKNNQTAATVLELTGSDRPGLLSEVFAVLSDLKCTVTDAKVWTHNGHVGSVILVHDEETGFGIVDSIKIRCVVSRLSHVVQGRVVSSSSTEGIGCHTDRRLHQLMFADRDYENILEPMAVSVQNLIDRGYSIVNVSCNDRSKLLFDIISVLTDMEYVVFHGNIDTDGDRAHQEFYIRHKDGTPIRWEAERWRVIQCLQAAIERRSYKGLRLELCTGDSRVLLSEVTRAFRENGMLVTRAEVSTDADSTSAMNVFYVTDAAGELPDISTVDAVRQRIGVNYLHVNDEEKLPRSSYLKTMENGEGKIANRAGVGLVFLGSLVLRNLYNLGLIRSCS